MSTVLILRPGDLVDLYDEGDLVSAVVIGHEKGRFHVVTQGGKELRVAASRVAHRAGGASTTASAKAAASEASRHARAAAERVGEIDLPGLWEVLADEPQRYTLGSLAALALGEDSPVTRSAMLRRLQRDRTYFERAADSYEPRDREDVEESLKREAAERARAQRRAAFISRAREAMSGSGQTPSVASSPAVAPREDRELVADLVELAIMGDESPSRKQAVALLDDAAVANGPAGERAFRLLQALGLFKPDENLFIHRFGLRTSFPAAVSQWAQQAIEQPAPQSETIGRRDLREAYAFTIDDEQTTEMDDALSLEASGSRIKLGIHIADPGRFVVPGDPVDKEALARAATFYFPEVKLPMMPAAVAERGASLVPGETRPALSFLVSLSPLGEVLESEIVPSLIQSRARLTYEQADALLTGGGEKEDTAPIARALRLLRPLCEALEAERVAAGAITIRAAEVQIKVTPGGDIDIKRIDDRGVSRWMVSEAMILANRLAAEFCAKRGVPAIYRRQQEPLASTAEVARSGPIAQEAGGYDPVAVRALRRRMRRGETSLVPAPHHGLGLSAYTQATSPIRRYQDLVVHRQIKAVLAAQPPPYDAEALARIAASTEEAEKAAREAERGTDEYWILKHYEKRIGEKVRAVIVAVDSRRTEVEMVDTLYNVHIATRPDHRPGQEILLTLVESRPRAGKLVLREPGLREPGPREPGP